MLRGVFLLKFHGENPPTSPIFANIIRKVLCFFTWLRKEINTPSYVMLHHVYRVQTSNPPCPALLSGVIFAHFQTPHLDKNYYCFSFSSDLKKIYPHNDFCFHAVASFFENTTYIGSERPGFGDISTAWRRKQIDSIRVKKLGWWYTVCWFIEAYIWWENKITLFFSQHGCNTILYIPPKIIIII